MKCPKCETVNPAGSKFCRECATPLPSYEEPQISVTRTMETTTDELARGTVFAGRYEIIEELGAGGMGRVYRAHDTKLNEEVALKLIKPEIAADKRTVERFRNEIKNARRISHPNVCRTHDLGEAGSLLYLTMEYVRGEDLKSLIHRTRTLSVGTAVSVGRQIAEGLAEAHKQGIVHRDLKPGNVMIDKDGRAKIMDFGIARALSEKGITGAGAMIGTPEYMSPEQVDGKPADGRADLYALGAILFEMVTGRVPFEGDTPFSIANKHKSEPPPIPKKLLPQIPEGLNRLILRCLEKEREKRYQTADDLVVDLAGVEQALPQTERAATKRRTITRREITVKFEPRRLIIPAAAVLVLVAAGFFLWRNVIHKPAPIIPAGKPTLAVLSFRNNSGDATLDIWKENLPTLLAGGLGQSRYLRLLDDPTVYGILKNLNLLDAEKFTPEELKNIAAAGGATHLVSGRYLKAGGKIIIDLSLIDAKTGTVLAPLQGDAPTSEAIFDSVDGLVKKVKSSLNVPEQAVDETVYKMVGEVYTRNPQALQAYIEGEKLHQSARSKEAIAAFEKAFGLDPEFAMAYSMAGVCATNPGVADYVKAYRYVRKAFELRDRVPEKDRLLIEGGWYMLREETHRKAYEIYKRAVERYPEDFQSRNRLAFLASDLLEAIREYEYLLRSQHQTRSWMLVSKLIGGYCSIEDYKRARELCQEWADSNPSKDAWDHCLIASAYLLEKNLDAAAKEYATAVSIAPKDPDIRAQLVNLDWTKGEPDKALRTLREIAEEQKNPSLFDDWKMVFLVMKGGFVESRALGDKAEKKALAENRTNLNIAELLGSRGKEYLQTGQAATALEKLRQGLEYVQKEESQLPETGLINMMHIKRPLMAWQVCALCDLGRVGEAEAVYRQLVSLVPGYAKKSPKPCFCMNTDLAAGKVALAKNDGPAAVRLLEECRLKLRGESILESSDHAYVFDTLGDAYVLAGRLDKAAEIYARIRELQNGRLEWGAVYSRSFYKLGKVYERMARKEEARKEYTKFLDLWKDADPGQPEVEDAEKRLASLK